MDYVLIGFMSGTVGGLVGALGALAGIRYVSERNIRRSLLKEFPETERLV